MTVLNHDKLLNSMVGSIGSYLKDNNLKRFVICDYKNANCYLIKELCAKIPNIDYFVEGEIWGAVKKAEESHGLILGTLNRNEAELIRRYHKYHEGIGDLFPIADLFYSEVLELLNYLGITDFEPDPKIDEMLTYSEVEWGDRENWKKGIIINKQEPKTSRAWFRYTIRQKEILSRMHQIEKRTRHKKIHAPIRRIRSAPGFEGLVR